MRQQVYDFSKDIEEEIKELSAKDFRTRSTPRAKKLIEELLPLSRLALTLKCLGLEIDVEITAEGSEADAIIYEKGLRNRELKIQITYSFNHEELLIVNSNKYIQRCTQEIIRLYEKKVAKQYKSKMVLLICFSEMNIKGLPNWSCLYENLKNKMDLTKNDFLAIYLFNEASNEIYQIA